MNIWIDKSIKLANLVGYLDSLFNVYPVEVQPLREISNEILEAIFLAYKSKDQKRILEIFLSLPRFPFDDPYIATLRHHRFLLEKNPQTVNRLGSRLLSMPLDNLIKLATQPKSPSRQIGNSFKKWLRNLGYPFIEENEFLSSRRIAFLKGSDKELKTFAENQLGLSLAKGIDFILKIGEKLYMGEAKFISDYGGSQTNQFNYAIEIASINKANVQGIAVLDGIIWFESQNYMHRTLRNFQGIALSSLLLREFIEQHK
jgi:hypothetical protein